MKVLATIQEKITQTDLLASGWTKNLIEQLLPEPELKRNPHYRSAPPMKLWLKEDVDIAMTSQKFISKQVGKEKRCEAAKRALKTKVENLMCEVTKLIDDIEVQIIDDESLVRDAISSRMDWYAERSIYRSVNGADEKTINRWVVNYIRHELTIYDKGLYQLAGKVGCHEAYLKYKKAVLTKIAEAYPTYAQQCIDDIERM